MRLECIKCVVDRLLKHGVSAPPNSPANPTLHSSSSYQFQNSYSLHFPVFVCSSAWAPPSKRGMCTMVVWPFAASKKGIEPDKPTIGGGVAVFVGVTLGKSG
jgi:hypothetical protein